MKQETHYFRNVKKYNYCNKQLYSDLIKNLKDEKERLSFLIQNDDVYFGIPDNVYVIGMMNDVDKSIDSFDLALRRRFKWIRKEYNYSSISCCC